MSGWTEERTEQLRCLCAEGLSYSEIGAAMGITRCAALGRAHRIGINNGIPPNHQGRQNGGRPKKAQPIAAIIATPFVAIPDPEPSERVKMLDLQSHHCRFPFGDPQQEDFGFCGRQKAPSKSFCPTHAARCYVPATVGRPRHDSATIIKTASDVSDSTPDLVADISDEKAQAA